MENLKQELEELKKLISKLTRKNQSEQLNELFTALAKAQAEIVPVKKNCVNPFFKSNYANLMSVVEAARPSLCKNGLSVIQMVESCNGDGQFLISRLCHASGQWIESRIKLAPLKPDVQSLGAYLTYVRRYVYGALIGVVDTDEDDDGEDAMPPGEPVKPSYISSSQVDMINSILMGEDELKTSILKSLKISSIDQIPVSEFNRMYKGIQEFKAKAKGK